MADKDFVKKYLEDFSDLIKADEKIVEKIITTKDILINAKKSSNKIMIFGNGGSTAIASPKAAVTAAICGISSIIRTPVSPRRPESRI